MLHISWIIVGVWVGLGLFVFKIGCVDAFQFVDGLGGNADIIVDHKVGKLTSVDQNDPCANGLHEVRAS